MGESSATLHEDPAQIGEETIDRHRAIVSIMEELEAVDWYDQRVQATSNAELRAILAHNRDEEKEHACMVLEWLRRNDPKWHEQLSTYLFTSGDVTELEEDEQGGETGNGGNGKANGVRDRSLGIGSLRKG
ncbi:MAG: ferritin [Rhodospirillales bacterium]|nr:MAG: ferritin [Rhodospirillales bacterium]